MWKGGERRCEERRAEEKRKERRGREKRKEEGSGENIIRNYRLIEQNEIRNIRKRLICV